MPGCVPLLLRYRLKCVMLDQSGPAKGTCPSVQHTKESRANLTTHNLVGVRCNI